MWRWIWTRKWRLLLASVATLVCGWLIWTEILRAELEAKLQAMRDAGHPVEPADLFEEPVPDDQNAAFLYSVAAEMVGELPYAITESDEPEFLEPEDIEEAASWLESKAQVVAMLHQAANREKCVFDIDWARGFEMEIEFIPQSQKFTQLLEAYGKKRARKGNAQAALRCVDTIVRMARHMPAKCFICYLVRVTLYGKGIHLLRDIAVDRGFDPVAARARVEPYLATAADMDVAVSALRSDLALILGHSRRWIAGESPIQMLDAIAGDPVLFGEEESTESENRTGRMIVDWIAGSWILRPIAIRDAIFLIEEFESEIERLATTELTEFDRYESRSGRGLPYFFCAVTDPRVAVWGAEILALHAHIAVTRAGLDALIHKKRHGLFPDDLTASPVDPYTGKPLLYEHREDGTARIEAARPIEDYLDREEWEIVWELK